MGKLEDVVIIGGGPAGACCAFELAKKGIYAPVIDYSHPREKPCGGGMSSRTVKGFPFIKELLDKGRITTKLKIISSPPQNQQFIATENQRRFIIARRYFDEGILNMALQNGAKLIKEKVINIKHNKKNYWYIRTNKRSLETKIIVGADGITSLVRRKTLGKNITFKEYAKQQKKHLALTFGYIASGVENEPPTIRYLGKNPDLKKEDFKGYIWILPRVDHSSIGIGSELRCGGRLLKRLLDEFIDWYCPHITRISTFAWMLPSATDTTFFEKPCAGEDWILVGDAAGHADPINGEGIHYALWSAKLAAEAIEKKDLKSYDESWRSEYGDDLKRSCENKALFYSPLGKALAIIQTGASILEKNNC